MTVNYRESYGIFGASGILFNHESPLRGREFVTRKITDSVAKIKLGKLDCLELGNLDAKRDWGYAKEYVEGMWLMLQAPEPDTYVLATNRAETVRDFVRMAFKAAGITVEFNGKAEGEMAVDVATGKTVMRVNAEFYRPTEGNLLIGNPAKAKAMLGWEPKTTLEQLCALLVEADLKRNERDFSFYRSARSSPAPADENRCRRASSFSPSNGNWAIYGRDGACFEAAAGRALGLHGRQAVGVRLAR
jgi:GDPmannose 4,6-dehydratase